MRNKIKFKFKKRVKIAETKDRRHYVVLGVVAIVAIVGLVLVFSEKFDFAKKTMALDKGNEITSFSVTSLFSKQDCVLSSTRPCYDKKTGKKFIPLEPKGAENAFAACLKNRAPNENGELAAKTSKCDAER